MPGTFSLILCKRKLVLCLAVLILAAVPAFTQNTDTISKVIDGDSFKLSNGQKLKLAGINAPEILDNNTLRQESRKFGKDIWVYRTLGGDAAKEAGRILAMGKNKICLESGTEAFDADGNLFAYVYVPVARWEEGMAADEKVFLETNGQREIFLNAHLVQTGFAEVISMPLSAKHQALFLGLQREAKEHKRGLWG